MDITKLQLSELMSFIVVTYRNMHEGLLTTAEMTQRQPYHGVHPAYMIAHESQNPGARCTANRLTLQVPQLG